MLWHASAINGYRIEATDGSLGTVRDLLFDDQSWTIRWLVVDTGDWLPGREVLLPTSALGIPSIALRTLPVRLTRQQVEDAPGAEADLPVSRQMEGHLANHYGANGYQPRGNAYLSPLIGFPSPTEPAERFEGDEIVANTGDSHLRSTANVTGYHIRATDGDIGHVEDFIFDDASWRIIYLGVDTNNWWPDSRVLILPQMVREVDWSNSLLHIHATQQKVRDAPAASKAVTVDDTYAQAISAYYGLGLFAV